LIKLLFHMKIIKTLQTHNLHPYQINTRRPYMWGLGEDGELYYQYREDSIFREYIEAGFSISLREMKEIVKAFGHLIIFT
jgi:hypothetical protein